HPIRELPEHVHISPSDVEGIDVIYRVLVLIHVLRVHDTADRHLRARTALCGQLGNARRSGHDGHPERPTRGERHWLAPLLGNGLWLACIGRETYLRVSRLGEACVTSR